MTDTKEQIAADAKLRVQGARALLIAGPTPYLATALSRMVPVATPGLGTYATDKRWRFYYDPARVVKETPARVAGAWLHELSHCLRDHPARFTALSQPSARASMFNVAADAVLNTDLVDLAESVGRGPRNKPLIALGKDWVYVDTLDVGVPANPTAEEIYWLLVAKAQQSCPQHRSTKGGKSPAGPGGQTCTCGRTPDTEPLATGHGDCGSGAAGARREWELPDTGDDGSVDPDDADIARRATAADISRHEKARGRGSVPGGMARWACELLDPVVDWRAELRALVSTTSTSVSGQKNYSYARLSRRRIPGVVLPAMVGARPPRGAVVVDTSGSMGEEDLGVALTETNAILRRVSKGRSPLHVISCDAGAAEAVAIRAISDINLVGGGGTDMRVGIEKAAELAPDFVIIATDGDTPWPDEPPATAPNAVYIALIVGKPDGYVSDAPEWMKAIVVPPR